MDTKDLLSKEFEDIRELIVPKDVDHSSKQLINDIIHNLKTDKSLDNRVIRAGINSLERLYNIVVETKINKKTKRIEVTGWFKERRKNPRAPKKGFKDIIIL